jgi:hypothetical protein
MKVLCDAIDWPIGGMKVLSDAIIHLGYGGSVWCHGLMGHNGSMWCHVSGGLVTFVWLWNLSVRIAMLEHFL